MTPGRHDHRDLPPPLGSPARWSLFPTTTVLVVVLQALVWVRPGLSGLQVASGLVLVCALGGAAVCLVRAPRWPDARPVGIGLVWALPIGFIDLMFAFAQPSAFPP